jgi:glutaredoxin
MADNLRYTEQPVSLVMYSASWCPDCKRSKAFLDRHQVEYTTIDIGKDTDAFIFLEKLTRRVRIPTLVFPDRTILIEPSDEELGRKLGFPPHE